MPADCDSADEMATELCSSPQLLMQLSKNGILALACLCYVGMNSITTNHMRITLMLVFAWFIAKDTLQLDVSHAVLMVVYGIGVLHLLVLPKKMSLALVGLAAFANYDAHAKLRAQRHAARVSTVVGEMVGTRRKLVPIT